MQTIHFFSSPQDLPPVVQSTTAMPARKPGVVAACTRIQTRPGWISPPLFPPASFRAVSAPRVSDAVLKRLGMSVSDFHGRRAMYCVSHLRSCFASSTILLMVGAGQYTRLANCLVALHDWRESL